MAKERRQLRVASWNINGLRAAANKGFLKWLAKSRAQIVGVQEVRANQDQLPEEVKQPRGWHSHFVSAEKKGYSGVGLYSRIPADAHESSLGRKEFDAEGRVQIARFGALKIVNAYFPNGNGKDRDNSRVPYKLRFYRRLFRLLEAEKREGGRIVVMGDFNTAHEDIDLARPKQNRKTSGFLPEERKELSRWLNNGWVDGFRRFETGEGHYTWWSQRFGVREKNIGWRLDYTLVSPGAAEYLQSARIHPDVKGSDHCPISVCFDGSVLK